MTKLEKIVAYACGRADPEAAEEIRREAADPKSETMQFVRGLARAAANPLRLAGMPPLGSLDCPAADVEIDNPADAAIDADEAGLRGVEESRETALGPDRGQIIDEDPVIVRLPSRPEIAHGLRLRWFGYWIAKAAAACLLVALGFLIASRTIPGGGPEILLASASPKLYPARGAEDARWVEVRSGLSGFATLVCLIPGERQQVVPRAGGDDFAVGANVPEELPLPSGTERVVVVVTETPAADPIRRAIRGESFAPQQAEQLRSFLRSTLEAKGYRRMALGGVSFDL